MLISRFNLYFLFITILFTIFVCTSGSRQPRTIRGLQHGDQSSLVVLASVSIALLPPTTFLVLGYFLDHFSVSLPLFIPHYTLWFPVAPLFKHYLDTVGVATLRVLGLGPWCVGCPAQYCDDDPNIIQGYCCGCARFMDSLPVECSPSLRCPLNTYHLCRRYEYMMHCCC